MAHDPLSNKAKIAKLLTHYIKPGFEAQHGWTSDNYAEMDHLAELIIEEIGWKIYQHEQRETAQVDVLDNFTEHPVSCGDDEEQVIVGLG